MCTRKWRPNPMQGYEHLIGLKVDEAQHITSHKLRVVMRDDIPMVVTRDYNPNRLNLHVVADSITVLEGFY